MKKWGERADQQFIFTPSRYPILEIFEAFLSVRSQENFHFGLLLEGRSGFMFIGTQNSLSMFGREPLSSALKARLTSVIVPEYSREELASILVAKGVSQDNAVYWVDQFITSCTDAKDHGLEPIPNLRDLLRATGVFELENMAMTINSRSQGALVTLSLFSKAFLHQAEPLDERIVFTITHQ